MQQPDQAQYQIWSSWGVGYRMRQTCRNAEHEPRHVKKCASQDRKTWQEHTIMKQKTGKKKSNLCFFSLALRNDGKTLQVESRVFSNFLT